MFSKYSKKCINMVNRYNLDFQEITNFSFFRIITDLLIKTNKPTLNNMHTNITEKIPGYTSEISMPICYDILKEFSQLDILKKIIKTDIDANIFSSPEKSQCLKFVSWYNLNQHLIDVEKIYDYYSMLSDTCKKHITYMFDNTTNKKYLNLEIYSNNFVSLDIQKLAESETLQYSYIVHEELNIHIHLYLLKDE